MRTIVAFSAAVLLSAAPAIAQTSSTAPAAVANPNNASKTTAAPVAGKNSFTMKEAATRLQDHGFSNITGLTKDAQSVWRGKAMKDGQTVDVSVDYQGNITP